MANFFNTLPDSVLWEGNEVKITPAFDNVLNMYVALDSCITDTEKIEVMGYYLTYDGIQDIGLVEKIINEIITKPKHSGCEKAFDFVQDSEYIYAAFMQAYGIDLINELGCLHWWKFNALLKSLPQNTRFQEIIQIRLRPIPKPTKDNAVERQNLMRLKNEYRLEVSEKERQETLQNGLQKMAVCLMGMADGKN